MISIDFIYEILVPYYPPVGWPSADPASVARNSWVDAELEVEKGVQSYLDRLDKELAEQPSFEKPPAQAVKNVILPAAQTRITAAFTTGQREVSAI